MQFEPEGPDPAEDAFDFTEAMAGLPPGLQEMASRLAQMEGTQRRHLAIALGFAGAAWIAPLAGAVRLRRRRRRRRRRQAGASG